MSAPNDASDYAWPTSSALARCHECFGAVIADEMAMHLRWHERVERMISAAAGGARA